MKNLSLSTVIAAVALAAALASTPAYAASSMQYLGNVGAWATVPGTDLLIVADGSVIKAINLSNSPQVLWERGVGFRPDHLAVSPDREYVAACSNTGGAALIYIRNGSSVGDVRGVCPAAFSPDSAWLALGGVNQVRLYGIGGGLTVLDVGGTPSALYWVGDSLVAVVPGARVTYLIRPGEAAQALVGFYVVAGAVDGRVVLYSSKAVGFVGPEGLTSVVATGSVVTAKALSNGVVVASLSNGSVAVIKEDGVKNTVALFPPGTGSPTIDEAYAVGDYAVVVASVAAREWGVLVINIKSYDPVIAEVSNETYIRAYPGEEGYLLVTRGKVGTVYRLGSSGADKIAEVSPAGVGVWCGNHLIIGGAEPKSVTVEGDKAIVEDAPIKGNPIKLFGNCSLLLTGEAANTYTHVLRVYATGTWEQVVEKEIRFSTLIPANGAYIKELNNGDYLIIYPQTTPQPEYAVLIASATTAQQGVAWYATPAALTALVAGLVALLALYLKRKMRPSEEGG